jgi:hypothetical protein
MENDVFAVERGGSVIFRSAKVEGTAALLVASAAHGEDLRGAIVHCAEMSNVGFRIAEFLGIRDIVRATESQNGSPLEALSEETPDPARLVRILRRRLSNVLDHNLSPTDENLARELPVRLSGGGGT